MRVDPSRTENDYRDRMLLPPPSALHLMVVVSSREARVFRIRIADNRPQQVIPYDPTGCGLRRRFRRAPPTSGSDTILHSGLIGMLRGADTILIVGHGRGAAEAVTNLLAELRHGHPDLSRRVYTAGPIMTSHLAGHRLLALARTTSQGEWRSGRDPWLS